MDLNDLLNTVIIAPNPVRGELKLLVNTTTRAEGELQIFDMNGKVMMRFNTGLIKGQNIVSYPLYGKLADGTYYLRVRFADYISIQKFNVLK